MEPTRCAWPGDDALMIAYHDREWGVPLHDDRKHFEFLVLDGAQAGLSWRTVLHKREAYRRAFAAFDPVKVARFDARKVQALLADPGIIRNKLKVAGAVKNARAFLALQNALGGFDDYIWQFVDGRPRHNAWKTMRQIPTRSRESDAMSKDLKARGFTFVGTTICYAYMQAAGMVNDHLVGCFRHHEVGGRATRTGTRRSPVTGGIARRPVAPIGAAGRKDRSDPGADRARRRTTGGAIETIAPARAPRRES